MASAVAPEKLRTRVSQIITTNGTEKASESLGVSPEALARLVGGLTVRNGTIAQVEKRIAELEKRK